MVAAVQSFVSNGYHQAVDGLKKLKTPDYLGELRNRIVNGEKSDSKSGIKADLKKIGDTAKLTLVTIAASIDMLARFTLASIDYLGEFIGFPNSDRFFFNQSKESWKHVCLSASEMVNVWRGKPAESSAISLDESSSEADEEGAASSESISSTEVDDSSSDELIDS